MGTLGIVEFITANGADVSETLAPRSIRGNQEAWKAKKKLGGRTVLIEGMEQQSEGSAKQIKEQVRSLFRKEGYDGGYILSCADHFLETPVENLAVYAAAAHECEQ